MRHSSEVEAENDGVEREIGGKSEHENEPGQEGSFEILLFFKVSEDSAETSSDQEDMGREVGEEVATGGTEAQLHATKAAESGPVSGTDAKFEGDDHTDEEEQVLLGWEEGGVGAREFFGEQKQGESDQGNGFDDKNEVGRVVYYEASCPAQGAPVGA